MTGIHISIANGEKTKHPTRTISVLPGNAKKVGEVNETPMARRRRLFLDCSRNSGVADVLYQCALCIGVRE